MKTYRQMVAEVSQPSSGDELNFKEKHVIDHILDPNAEEEQFTADQIKKFKNRADYAPGESAAVYEATALTRDVPGQEDGDVDNDGDEDDVDSQLRYRRHANIKKNVVDEDVSPTHKDGYYVTDHNMKLTHSADKPYVDSKAAISKANRHEIDSGRVHTVTHIKAGKVHNQWQYADSHQGWAKYKDYAGTPSHHMLHESEQIDELTRKTLVSYARKAPDSARALDTMSISHAKSGRAVHGTAQSKDLYQKSGELAGKASTRRRYFDKAMDKLESTDADKMTAFDKAREAAVTRKLQKEGIDKPTSRGATDLEPSHVAYKKKNAAKPHHTGEAIKIQEGDVSIGSATPGMKVFAGNTKSATIHESSIKPGSLKLKDGAVVRLSADDVKAINGVMGGLSADNRGKMQDILMSGKKGFNDILSFAKEAQ